MNSQLITDLGNARVVAHCFLNKDILQLLEAEMYKHYYKRLRSRKKNPMRKINKFIRNYRWVRLAENQRLKVRDIYEDAGAIRPINIFCVAMSLARHNGKPVSENKEYIKTLFLANTPSLYQVRQLTFFYSSLLVHFDYESCLRRSALHECERIGIPELIEEAERFLEDCYTRAQTCSNALINN